MSAEKKELSPEEKLLQVIQKGKAADGESVKPAPPPQPPPRQPAAPPPPILKAVPQPAAPPPQASTPAVSPPGPSAPQPVVAVKAQPAPAIASSAPVAESDRKLKVVAPPPPAVKSDAIPAAKEATPASPTELPQVPATATASDSIIVPGPDVPAQTGLGQLLGGGGKKITIAMVNRYLFLIVLVLMGVVIYDLLLARTGGATAEPVGGIVNKTPLAAWKVIPLNPVNVYTEQFAKRDIWKQPGEEKPGEGKKDADKKAVPQSSFKLVALSIDRGAPAESMAIISDQASAKTYFVKGGQPLGETGYVLEKLFDDRVILKSRKGELNLP